MKRSDKHTTILFACGGTGGHLFPAIAIADELKKNGGVKPVFVGTASKIESRIVPQKGFEFHTIWISGFQRRAALGNLLIPLKAAVSLIQSFRLLRLLRPALVIGTGGYVCGPVLFMAALLKIPTIVHESNSYPGVTTKLLARRVTKLFITFEATRQWLPQSGVTVELVGNPTRSALGTISRDAGIQSFGLVPEKKTVLIFGGSLGAASINKAMKNTIDDLMKDDRQVIWQTGEADSERRYNVQRDSRIVIRQFIDAMEYAYAAADVVVCRAGATSLAELTRIGKPAILIPYPHAAADHQMMNARTMAEQRAAEIIPDHEAEKKLSGAIRRLLSDPGSCARMAENAKRLGVPEAAAVIAEKIFAMTDKKCNSSAKRPIAE